MSTSTLTPSFSNDLKTSDWNALKHVSWFTMNQGWRTQKTWIVLGLIGLGAITVTYYATRHAHLLFPAEGLTIDEFNKQAGRFTKRVVVPLFFMLMLPLLTLVYSVSALGDDIRTRRFLYVLVRPIRRWQLYLAKFVGLAPLTLTASLMAWAAICLPAGPVGYEVMTTLWPPVILGTLAYTALFLAFGGLLPRPMVIAVLYAFFLEVVLSAMPGTIKRVAVSFYCHCMVYRQAEIWGMTARNRYQFQPIDGELAGWVLMIAIASILTVGAMLFHRRDFKQLG